MIGVGEEAEAEVEEEAETEGEAEEEAEHEVEAGVEDRGRQEGTFILFSKNKTIKKENNKKNKTIILCKNNSLTYLQRV